MWKGFLCAVLRTLSCFGYNVQNKCIKIVALFRCVWHICSPWTDGPNWICGMKLSCRNCCGQCLHGSTLVFPSCAWLGKASLAESWLGFFLWEDLGGDDVGLGGLLGRFFLNSKFTFKPLPLEAAGTACGQVRATFVYGGWEAVGQEPLELCAPAQHCFLVLFSSSAACVDCT